MLRKIFLLAALLCCTTFVFSQDTLFLLNKSKIICRVLKINFANVTYITTDTLTKHKEILIPKSLVRSVTYANGFFEIVSLRKIRKDEITSMFIKGSNDATVHYKHPGGSIGTGITSFLTGGIVGLVPAIACSATTPKITNLGLPKDALINNKEYMLGYTYTAKKIKQKKVWGGYALGILGAVAFLLITH